MSLYGRVVAAGYDAFMAAPERAVLRPHRSRLLRGTRGRVLEIGGGTGANLPFYPRTVEELVITEPDEAMARRLEANVARSSLPARVVRAPAESLPSDARDFDFVVSTLVLCTVSDPARSLREIDRVLKPNGQLLFLEHVRSEGARLARWQERLDRIWMRLGHGCHSNRRTLEMVRRAGFTVTDLEHDELRKAVPIVRPLVIGTATKAVRASSTAPRTRSRPPRSSTRTCTKRRRTGSGSATTTASTTAAAPDRRTDQRNGEPSARAVGRGFFPF